MTETLTLHAAEETLEAVHTRRHATYPAYKQSGVEWLGDVPEHWDVKRLKFISRINPSASEIVDLRDEDEVSFIPMDAVGEYGGMRLDTDKRLEEVRSGFTYFRDEDVVIAKITPCFENGKGGIAEHLTNGVAFGTTELHVVRPESKLGGRFLFYLTISDAFRRLGASEMYGAGGQKRVPTDFVRDFLVGLPPLEEQQAIACFLDEQTRKIDDLIEAKRSLLDLLKEKRQAVITHAVTRGLDPAAKLKPSGVEWLGDVPEHWKYMPIKWLVETPMTDGPHETPEWVDEGVPFVSAEGVFDGRVHLDRSRGMITLEQHREYSKKVCPRRDDIFIVKSGATTGKIGYVDFDDEFNVWSPLAVIRCDEKTVLSRYAFHAFVEKSFQRQIQLFWSYGTQPNIGMGSLENLDIAVPPLKEQQQIVRFLDEGTQKMDDLESVVREAIATLELLRASIISATVTGQIDVRGEGA